MALRYYASVTPPFQVSFDCFNHAHRSNIIGSFCIVYFRKTLNGHNDNNDENGAYPKLAGQATF